jgi:hypothetical protein
MRCRTRCLVCIQLGNLHNDIMRKISKAREGTFASMLLAVATNTVPTTQAAWVYI